MAEPPPGYFFPPTRPEDVAFWSHVRAALSEGFCPTPDCGGRLAPAWEVPTDGVGGRCARHGVRWMRQDSLASF